MKKNKKKRKKEYSGPVKIFRLLVLGGAFGYFLGMFAGLIGGWLGSAQQIRPFILSMAPYLFYGAIIIFSVGGFIFYFTGKREFLDSIREESEIFSEDKLSISLGFWSIGSLVIFLCFALVLEGAKEAVFGLQIPISSFLLIFIVVLFSVMQKKIVELAKIGYPEKEGDVYDLSFQKDWLGSMDEREQIETYYAGFKAYSFVNYLLLAFIIVLTILSMYMEIQLLSYFILLTFSVFINIIYIYYSIKGRN